MKRRRFLLLGAGASAALLAGWLRGRQRATAVVRALRGGRYPGRLVEPDLKDIAKPGSWLG